VASVATIVVLALHDLVHGTFGGVFGGLVVAAVTWALWWTIRVTSGNGLGYGDVRLATMAALPLGGLSWPSALLLTPAVFLVAAPLLLPLRATVRAGRAALAPAMALAWAGVLCLAADVPAGIAG
jgi:leader peptidase (prepilin peptidase)/N-methyltransferase